MMKKLLGLVLVISLGLITFLALSRNSLDEAKAERYSVVEEIIIEDYWQDNRLRLTRKTESSEEGTAVWIPTDLMVKEDKLYLFNSEGNNIIEVNMSGELQNIYPTSPNSVNFGLGLKNGLLYYATPRAVYELDLSNKENKKIFSGIIGLAGFREGSNTFYIVDPLFETVTLVNKQKSISALNIGDLFIKNNMPRPQGHRRFLKDNCIYSPSEFKYVNSEEAYYKSESYSKDLLVINIDTQEIVSINSQGREFGYYILGIDNKERIYSTTSLYVDRILVHDEHGHFHFEIKPECARYGKPVSSIYDELLVHPVYITENGDIFIMIQTEEGTFIVRYTHSA